VSEKRPAAAQPNPRPVVAVGTALFFLGFVVLLPFYNWLGEHHHRDWLWTCLAGWLLGLAGWALMRKHRREGRTV
jgi:H+/Cl- antiporter ClcA